VVVSLASKLETAQSQLSVTQRSLTSTEDSLKLRMMELEGANAQLQVRFKMMALGRWGHSISMWLQLTFVKGADACMRSS
jgi:hypothetical protein